LLRLKDSNAFFKIKTMIKIIVTAKLKGFHGRSERNFELKNGKYRGVTSYLRKVRKMFKSASQRFGGEGKLSVRISTYPINITSKKESIEYSLISDKITKP
jgi:hypothetical protein